MKHNGELHGKNIIYSRKNGMISGDFFIIVSLHILSSPVRHTWLLPRMTANY